MRGIQTSKPSKKVFSGISLALSINWPNLITDSIMEPTGKSWEYLFERLLPLWPWELRDFYDKICENNESVFGEIHFQMAVGSCYLNHARFNRFLSQESRDTPMDLVHRTKDLINSSWAKYPDKLDAFEKAFNFEVESTAKFG